MMKNNIIQGRIIKAVSGSYVVRTACGLIFNSQARGVFRKNEITPFVGDLVEFEIITDSEGEKGVINKIMPRKNSFRRPPLANLDRIIYVVSTAQPLPNTLIIDKLLAIAEYKNVESAIVITKLDIDASDEIECIYKNAGFNVLKTTDTEKISELLKGKISALSGNSGVGKSTLINKLFPQFNLQTAQISKKLGRGKHTTRHVELFELDNGGFLADTPGFSTVNTLEYDIISKEDLQHCFKEFAPFLDKCKFTDCSHTIEKGCAVLEALNQGLIQTGRHQSYTAMYEESKNYKAWN